MNRAINKAKKIIISAIVMIVGLIGFTTISSAYYVGQHLSISFQDYMNNSDIYCVEHGQSLKGTVEYDVISQVKIVGKTSTDHTGKQITHNDNAKLAYILSADNGDTKPEGPVANAIWNFMYTWMQSVGQYHAGLYKGFASNDKPGEETYLDKEATEYAENLRDTEITDNTNKDSIQVRSYQKDGQDYLRIGPFNWTFSGNITGIEVLDQDGNNVDGLLYSSFDGSTEYWYELGEIRSGRDFYISIPASTNISRITQVSATVSSSVKSVTIWFLESTNGYMQNLIIREPSEENQEITVPFDYDIPILGNLKVIKVNENNQEIKLSGVGFYIQNKQSGKYVYQDQNGNITYVDNREDATEFVTDSNGEILIKNLVVGTYVAYETKNPNYGYEIISDGVEQDVVVDKTTEFVIGNKQVYVKLSGFVWVDKPDQKQWIRNDLYDYDIYEGEEEIYSDGNDILLDGITVRLKDRTTGETVKETVTGQDEALGSGQYLFTDVLVEKLSDYYIEFEYDGLTYTNVLPYNQIESDIYTDEELLEQKTSKAAEVKEERDEFNKGFSVVEGRTQTTGYTRDENGNEKHQLSYNFDETEHKSTLINNGQYLITANTDVPPYMISEHFTDGQEEIKYINLGLYEREQPDMAVAKDIQNVRLTINGYEHTYEYAQRFNHPENYGGEGFNVGVKFGEKYAAEPYTRAIYEADYEYVNENDKSKELRVYITYVIATKNESTNLTAQINSFVDYYDSRYSLVAIGTSLDENGNISEGSTIQTYVDEAYNDNYNKLTFDTNVRVDPLTSTLNADSGNIYVQFELNREAVINILNGQENLDNFVEINSYSVFDGDGNVYAGIDKDSNPGNCDPENEMTIEDDTDKCLSLQLEVADSREMTGKVFEDEPLVGDGEDASGIMTGQVRQGSGIYEDGETGIEGVEVTLKENKETDGMTYKTTTVAEDGRYTFRYTYINYNGEEFEPNVSGEIPVGTTVVITPELVTSDTSEYAVDMQKGDFYIIGYVPGDYTLTYTWGNETYTVQNYKNTIYNSDRDQNDKEWYKQDVDTRYSDAIDDYELRQQIDEELKHIENGTQPTIDKMNSLTPTMGIGVEYDTTTTASTGDRYTYQIRNIDFGIIERAKQDVSLTKRISGLKITLANGQEINNVTLEENEDGTISLVGNSDNITYMPPSDATSPANGFIRAELDNEIIQGATLEVTYEFKVTNNSELDYTSENFYKYGIVEGDVVKISVGGIIDYLDNNWAFDNEQNADWQAKTLDEVKYLLQEDVYENELSTINDKTIIYTDSLKDIQIEPANSETTTLTASKILTTGDDISLDNETEIVEVDKTGGSSLTSIPGNYIPGTYNSTLQDINNAGGTNNSNTSDGDDTGSTPDNTEGDSTLVIRNAENDQYMAETVIVTPATGDDLNYIVPITIGIIALIIIGGGVVLIKKKALGK